MSDGIMLGMVRRESACVKAAREPSKTAAAQTRKVAAKSRRDQPVPSQARFEDFCYRNEMRHAFLNAGQGLSGYRR
jgi:hypothetical protein